MAGIPCQEATILIIAAIALLKRKSHSCVNHILNTFRDNVK